MLRETSAVQWKEIKSLRGSVSSDINDNYNVRLTSRYAQICRGEWREIFLKNVLEFKSVVFEASWGGSFFMDGI